jgi:hypothetical protein
MTGRKHTEKKGKGTEKDWDYAKKKSKKSGKKK